MVAALLLPATCNSVGRVDHAIVGGLERGQQHPGAGGASAQQGKCSTDQAADTPVIVGGGPRFGETCLYSAASISPPARSAPPCAVTVFGSLGDAPCRG